MSKKKNAKNQLSKRFTTEQKKNGEAKLLSTWVSPEFHSSFKSQAAKEGLFLEDLVFKAAVQYMNNLPV